MGSEGGVTHGVDATVDPSQAPSSRPRPNRPLTEPERQELGQRHHPMLTLGQLGDQHVERLRTYFRHSSYRNYVLTGHRVQHPARTRTPQCRSETFALRDRYE
jgi:hypothetical protein